MDQQSGIDPADQWVFDPETGSYQLRLGDGNGDGNTAPPLSHPPAHSQGRAAARAQRRAERRRAPKGRIPVWLGCTAALVIIGGGIGSYLFSGRSTAACTIASSPMPSPTAPPTVNPASNTQPAANALRGPMAAPIDVRVNIFDGTGRFGASQAVLSWLQNSNGVTRSTNAGPAAGPVAATTLDYAPNQADQARRLAKMLDLPASALKEGTKAAASRQPMILILGRDFTAPGQPFSTPASTPAATHPTSSPHC
jgi:LytR cell envelope-related transcriptional attenuator